MDRILESARGELRLQEFADQHVETLRAWLAKGYIVKWYKEPEAWIHEASARGSEYSFIRHFIVTLADREIGFCQYYACADADEEAYRTFPREGTYSIDYLIGEEDCLGKGLGKAIILELLRMIREIPDSRLVVVQPELDNLPSCKTLESCGFLYDEQNRVYYRTIER